MDVFVPLDDGRIDVYQVKRFDRLLTGGQWSKVKESYATLVHAVADGHFAVRNWYLTMPLDASDTDEAKFAELTSGGPFELCEWKGLAWLDALASEFPGVLDYYLGDGKARLEQTHRDLLAVLGARDAAGSSAGAAAVGDGLSALYRTLNDQDPLYRYDFAVGAATDLDATVPPNAPGSLVFIAQVSEGDVCVTWHVHARCDESVRERPIPIGVQFDVSGDLALRESLWRFAEYGQPFSAPDGNATISMELPGGLGGPGGIGSVWIGPTSEAASRRYVMRLRASRPHEGSVAVRLAMEAPTVGSRGARLSGQHDGGAFVFEALHDFEPASMQVRFSALELTGKPVASIIDGVEFLLALRGAALEVAAEHGPFMPFGNAVATESDDRGVGAGGSGDLELAALRSLYEIQQHTVTTVLVPDLVAVAISQAKEWGNIARILRGESVTDRRLGVLTTDLEQPPEQPLTGDNAFMLTTDLFADVGDQRLVLGQQTLHVDAATIQTDPDKPSRFTVTPWPDHSWTRTRAAPARPGGSPTHARSDDAPTESIP